MRAVWVVEWKHRNGQWHETEAFVLFRRARECLRLRRKGSLRPVEYRVVKYVPAPAKAKKGADR